MVEVAPLALDVLMRALEQGDRLATALAALLATRHSAMSLGKPLLGSAVAAYRGAFPARAFAAQLPEGSVRVSGAPDLIVQMLDKLIDNAVDFSPAGATITVRLRAEPQAALLEVENPGPPLPAHVEGRLFESLWQSRPDGDSRPHFGLGLYIVRLIAEFHGGEASARNMSEGGVRVTVRLAR